MARYRKGQGQLYRKRKNGKAVGSWFFKYRGQGINTHTTDKDEAERFRAIYAGQAAEGRLISHRPKVDALLDLVEVDYTANARASRAALMSRLKHLRPFFGSRDAQTLSSADLRSYTTVRLRQKASAATINRELQVLRKALNTGKDEELIGRVPAFQRVMLDEHNVRTGFIEPEDYARLRDSLSGPVRLLFVIAYHSGWRAGKILSLTWDRVDLDTKVIRAPEKQASNKRVGSAPIYGDLERELRVASMNRERDFPACPWVVSRAGQRVVEYRDAWAVGVAAAGLDGLLVHDLRRTAARNLRRMGLSEGETMKVLGHRTRAIFDRYQIVTDEDVSRQARELDRKAAEEAAKTTDGGHLGATHHNGVN